MSGRYIRRRTQPTEPAARPALPHLVDAATTEPPVCHGVAPCSRRSPPEREAPPRGPRRLDVGQRCHAAADLRACPPSGDAAARSRDLLSPARRSRLAALPRGDRWPARAGGDRGAAVPLADRAGCRAASSASRCSSSSAATSSRRCCSRTARRTGGSACSAFWKRRARRLLPALFVLIVAALVYSVVFLPDEVASLRGSALAGPGLRQQLVPDLR